MDRGEVEEAQLLGAIDRPPERAAVDDGCKVEQRARESRARDAISDGPVIGIEGRAAVDHDAGAGARPVAGNGHVDVRALVIDQPPQSRRGSV